MCSLFNRLCGQKSLLPAGAQSQWYLYFPTKYRRFRPNCLTRSPHALNADAGPSGIAGRGADSASLISYLEPNSAFVAFDAYARSLAVRVSVNVRQALLHQPEDGEFPCRPKRRPTLGSRTRSTGILLRSAKPSTNH